MSGKMQITVEEKTEGPSVESNLQNDLGSTEEEDSVGIEEMKASSKPATDGGSADTRRWTFAMALILVIVGAILSVAVIFALKCGEKEHVLEENEQWSLTIQKMTLERHQVLRQSMKALSNTISSSGNKWPLFTMPKFQAIAHDIMSMESMIESIVVANKVEDTNVSQWIDYTTEFYQEIVKEGHILAYGNLDKLSQTGYKPFLSRKVNGVYQPETAFETSALFPVWSQSPPPSTFEAINWNLRTDQTFEPAIQVILENPQDSVFTKLNDTQCFLIQPVFQEIGGNEVVALVIAQFDWATALEEIHSPQATEKVFVEIRNSCQQAIVFEVSGTGIDYIGTVVPTNIRVTSTESLNLSTGTEKSYASGGCHYSLHVYRTQAMHEGGMVNEYAKTASIAISVAFAFLCVAFIIYNKVVRHRYKQLRLKAERSNAIVESMFPEIIRDKILQDEYERFTPSPKASDGEVSKQRKSARKPLADLFLDTTVLFADIVGFTAWSSVREPCQVFTLLETLFSEFDKIANKRKIFKVETVGDCYVAVCGLPTPRKDHAVAMARFAREIMQKMQEVTHELEFTLGPDTGELTLRVGMHSGPCTGGVLRGERSRFQLFGETMNIASIMEHTCDGGRMQMSRETADLIIKEGKGAWLEKREYNELSKHKGQVETYWLLPREDQAKSIDRSSTQDLSETTRSLAKDELQPTADKMDEKTIRLIGWNVETLSSLLKKIVARQIVLGYGNLNSSKREVVDEAAIEFNKDTFLDEVAEIITLSSKVVELQNLENVPIPEKVIRQLKDYVETIAKMYNDNPFHNFEHASHVMMSVVKLLSRIVAPSSSLAESSDKRSDPKSGPTLHDHTYGICSDPLTQFACALSALIHDVDHSGVPNAQLIKENPALAQRYNSRSVAEQNSLDLAWDILMQPCYKELRATLYVNECQFRRFRQLLVNSVMATDIVDQELKKLRNARWEKAFADGDDVPPRDQINRKATIVIEHLIQASDVSHTMQHWHVYRKWNERFFEENYKAYVEGRIENDPSENWYKGEIGFFDFYIIPLAKKLKDCGVFGVSSDEYLQYATQNRKEWEVRGQEVVASMVQKYHSKYIKEKVEACKNGASAA